MSKKRFFAAALCAAVFAGGSVSAALAGEVTGNGKPTAAPDNANSICAFSGQNDGNPPPGRTAEHVQNWGQIPKAERDAMALEGASPGQACNGHSGWLAGP